MIHPEHKETYREYFQNIIKKKLKNHTIYIVLITPFVLLGLILFLYMLIFSIYYISNTSSEVPVYRIDNNVAFLKITLTILGFYLFYIGKSFLQELWLYLKLVRQGNIYTVTDRELDAMLEILKYNAIDIKDIPVAEPLKTYSLDVLRVIHFVHILQNKRVYRELHVPKTIETKNGYMLHEDL